MSDYAKIIGKRIRTKRKELNLTQEKLGEKVEIPQPYIGEIERGIRNVSLDTLEKICTALNISLFELFRIQENDVSNLDIEKQTLIELLATKLYSRKMEEVQLLYAVSNEIFRTYDRV